MASLWTKIISVLPKRGIHDSTSSKILCGKTVSRETLKTVKGDIAEIRKVQPNFTPGLAIVQVGDKKDSNSYIKSKLRIGNEVGIFVEHIKLSSSISKSSLCEQIESINANDKFHGVIVQLPLDSKNIEDSGEIINLIDPAKDVDGLTIANIGKLAQGDLKSGYLPCTPFGCMKMIEKTEIPIQGSRSVVLGRSKIVGSPMAELLKWNDSTVTVCHSKTRNLQSFCKMADILVVAVGKANFVPGNWIKEGSIVIDCGINPIPDPSKKSGFKIVGDIDFEGALERGSFVTPVPGGIGLMTVAMLMENTLLASKKQKEFVKIKS